MSKIIKSCRPEFQFFHVYWLVHFSIFFPINFDIFFLFLIYEIIYSLLFFVLIFDVKFLSMSENVSTLSFFVYLYLLFSIILSFTVDAHLIIFPKKVFDFF